MSFRRLNQPFLNGLFLGLVFSIAWTPCIGPVLGAILTLAARQQTSLLAGVLLAYYAAGLALPFLVIAFTGEAVARTIRPSKKLGQIFSSIKAILQI